MYFFIWRDSLMTVRMAKSLFSLLCLVLKTWAVANTLFMLNLLRTWHDIHAFLNISGVNEKFIHSPCSCKSNVWGRSVYGRPEWLSWPSWRHNLVLIFWHSPLLFYRPAGYFVRRISISEDKAFWTYFLTPAEQSPFWHPGVFLFMSTGEGWGESQLSRRSRCSTCATHTTHPHPPIVIWGQKMSVYVINSKSVFFTPLALPPSLDRLFIWNRKIAKKSVDICNIALFCCPLIGQSFKCLICGNWFD